MALGREASLLPPLQKKRLANILGLSGGLPSRSRPPPHSVPALPTPRKGKASVTPKLAPKTPIAQVKVGPKAEGSALEKASGAKAKSETAPLSGGSNGAAVSATRVPPAVNRSWPVVPRSAAAIRKSLQVGGREHGPSPPVAAPEEPGERPGSGSSDHLGASGTSGPSGRADTAGRTGVSGSFGLSWAAKTSEHLGTSGTSGPSGRLKISGKKAGVSGRFGPSGRAEIGRFGPSKTAEVPWFAGALGEFGPSWSSKASGRAESSGNPRASGTGGASAKSGASGIGELGKAGTSESQGSPKTGASGKEASAKGETDSSARVTTMVQVKHSKVAVAFRVDRKKKGGVKSNAELMAERLNML